MSGIWSEQSSNKAEKNSVQTADLTQPRSSVAMGLPTHQDMARDKVVNKTRLRLYVREKHTHTHTHTHTQNVFRRTSARLSGHSLMTKTSLPYHKRLCEREKTQEREKAKQGDMNRATSRKTAVGVDLTEVESRTTSHRPPTRSLLPPALR